MKICEQCGQRYRNQEPTCIACGFTLSELPSPLGMAADGTPLLCCPQIGCAALVGNPGAKFCDRCSVPLVPVSFELWRQKVVEPALEKDLIGVLQSSVTLLHSASEMGLPEDDAERLLDQAFAEKTGVDRKVLDGWLQGNVIPLRRAEVLEAGAVQASLARAESLNITPPCATMILKHFVPKLKSVSDLNRFSASPGAQLPTEGTPPVSKSGTAPEPDAGVESAPDIKPRRTRKVSDRRRVVKHDNDFVDPFDRQTSTEPKDLLKAEKPRAESSAIDETTIVRRARFSRNPKGLFRPLLNLMRRSRTFQSSGGSCY